MGGWDMNIEKGTPVDVYEPSYWFGSNGFYIIMLAIPFGKEVCDCMLENVSLDVT